VSDYTEEQRAAMAADLAERTAARMREGGPDARTVEALRLAHDVLAEPLRSLRLYRRALILLGVNDAGLDAASTAILGGRYPADSLPGKVGRMYEDATNGGPSVAAERALFNVLGLLGCE
jgi:hypothetical protein